MDLRSKLAEIQQNMKAPKNLYNSFGKYKYRNAEGILEAFKPYEGEYKVAMIINDEMVQVGDRIYVKATATIMDVESDSSISATAFAREAETKKGMDESQVTGTASSYARKYALNGLLLLDDTKDADTGAYHLQESVASKQAQDKEMEPIREQLAKLIAENNINESAFCKRYGASNVAELSMDDIDNAMGFIKRKLGK